MPEQGGSAAFAEQLRNTYAKHLLGGLALAGCITAMSPAAKADGAPPSSPSPSAIHSELDGFIGPNVRLYNKPSGYHTSTGEVGDKVYPIQMSKNGEWTFARLDRKDAGKPDSCGWTVTKVLAKFDPSKDLHEDDPCAKYIESMKLRRNIGDKFNGYGRYDGKIVKLTDKCDHHFYQNKYTNGVGFNNVWGTIILGDGFSDYVGEQYGTVRWRYTRYDQPKGMVEVGSDTYGWGMMDRGCVDPIDTEEPGGPEKDQSTQAGPDPNK
jgi:hypothetical protein